MPVQVQYVTTTDGVRVAYAQTGRGRPLLWMPPIPGRHLELEWHLHRERQWLAWLAGRYKLVQYDPRGLGLSERNVSSFSLDAQIRDLDAVVESVGGEKVVLMAKVNAAPIAIAYAARHPERVSHLILWCPTPRVVEGIGANVEALAGLARQSFELFTQTAAHLVYDWKQPEAANDLASLLRSCLDPATLPTLLRDSLEIDVSDDLARVRAPTLLFQRRDVTWVPMERAVELAATIPDSRMVILEGDSMALCAADMEIVTSSLDEFLGAPAPEAPAPAGSPDVFRCEGEYWTLAYDGRLCRLRDAKGLHHIAYLLRRPGEEVAAVDLLVALEGHDGPGSSRRALGRCANDVGPVLDPKARSEYRRRLRELRETLEEAEDLHDVGRVQAAREEMAFLERHLASSCGLGGRVRRGASTADRVRLTVTKRIKNSIEHIRTCDPHLARHLARCVRTGLTCCYHPAPHETRVWSF